MHDLFFVYYKDGKVKILNHTEAVESKENLYFNGWKHTATINPATMLEYLHNNEDRDFSWQSLHESLTEFK